MATDLAAAALDLAARSLAPGDLAARLDPLLIRLFVHEFNNRHSAVTGFASLLKRAVAEPGPRAAALAARLDEAAERTGRLARALAFLTAPPEVGDTAAEELLAPVEAIGAPHLLKVAGFALTCAADPGVAFRTAGPLAAKHLIFAAALLAGKGGALALGATLRGGAPTLSLAFAAGEPAPPPCAIAAASRLLRAIPGSEPAAGDAGGLPSGLRFAA